MWYEVPVTTVLDTVPRQETVSELKSQNVNCFPGRVALYFGTPQLMLSWHMAGVTG